MGTAARNYSWPPFGPDNRGVPAPPGNMRALQHGGYSPRKVDPLAADIIEQTRQHVTWWRPADEASVWAWARVEARVQLVTEWLTERGGDVADDGAVRPAADLLMRLEARAESMRSRLGLEPLSRARLGRDVAAQSLDVARFWAAQEAEVAAKGDAGDPKAGGNGSTPSAPAQEQEGDDAAA